MSQDSSYTGGQKQEFIDDVEKIFTGNLGSMYLKKDGTNVDVVDLPKIAETNVRAIEVTFPGLSAYIIKNNGKLYASGSDQYGQLGLDLGVNDRNVFTHVPSFDDREIADTSFV